MMMNPALCKYLLYTRIWHTKKKKKKEEGMSTVRFSATFVSNLFSKLYDNRNLINY